MRVQRYHLTIQGPFQELRGELLLQVDRTDVSGSLQVGDRRSYFQGKALRRNRYAAAVRLRTDVYEEDCDMLLRVRDAGAIRGSILGEWGTWTLEGTAEAEPRLVGQPPLAEKNP